MEERNLVGIYPSLILEQNKKKKKKKKKKKTSLGCYED